MQPFLRISEDKDNHSKVHVLRFTTLLPVIKIKWYFHFFYLLELVKFKRMQTDMMITIIWIKASFGIMIINYNSVSAWKFSDEELLLLFILHTNGLTSSSLLLSHFNGHLKTCGHTIWNVMTVWMEFFFLCTSIMISTED